MSSMDFPCPILSNMGVLRIALGYTSNSDQSRDVFPTRYEQICRPHKPHRGHRKTGLQSNGPPNKQIQGYARVLIL